MPTGVYTRAKRSKLSEEQRRNISIGTRLGMAKPGVIERLSLSLIGKKRPPFSEETRRKMSEAQRGNKHHKWKGGVESENRRIRSGIEFRLWREAVFARDNWTCQKFGTRGGTLHPHHILNFSSHVELRFAIDNGITLSEKAHNEFHKKYGKHNNNKEQLNEYLNE